MLLCVIKVYIQAIIVVTSQLQKKVFFVKKSMPLTDGFRVPEVLKKTWFTSRALLLTLSQSHFEVPPQDNLQDLGKQNSTENGCQDWFASEQQDSRVYLYEGHHNQSNYFAIEIINATRSIPPPWRLWVTGGVRTGGVTHPWRRQSVSSVLH